MSTDLNSTIEATLPRLQRYATKLTHDARLAEELVNDTVVRALLKQHLFREGTSFAAWSFTILHNEYVNQVRQRMRRVVTLDLITVGANLSQPPNQERRLALRDLDRALKNLSSAQRTAVSLIALQGLRYQTAAEVVGVPIGTIRSRLSRGLHKLRVAL
jgi:RNA polymerase sigma-70 factor (ECF subfamily)